MKQTMQMLQKVSGRLRSVNSKRFVDAKRDLRFNCQFNRLMCYLRWELNLGIRSSAFYSLHQ